MAESVSSYKTENITVIRKERTKIKKILLKGLKKIIRRAEDLIKDQSNNSPLVIILSFLITYSLDHVLGES